MKDRSSHIVLALGLLPGLRYVVTTQLDVAFVDNKASLLELASVKLRSFVFVMSCCGSYSLKLQMFVSSPRGTALKQATLWLGGSWPRSSVVSCLEHWIITPEVAVSIPT